MTIEALAGDVVALLDHLGIAEAELFGFSLVGLVAYELALGAPKMFELQPNAHLAMLPGTTHLGVTRSPANCSRSSRPASRRAERR